ncbi:hypothetical protein COCC4DRAFT_31615 [Bipolaris maydis ATCC 48331]|uniref:Uncharacterized protein n=2 Tax=Cochliobolus heterostrophus TaxID=5016 RepID=M2UEK2_COCH5|nr:uncharacterized protein COCC4DRAFT_31615 [Bipolaris maydis ATCC 48331]EMD86413.1 hypothetical protein COCHEDRAFT_1024072 [Bipolaris maydis C5]ENI06363.1 hypothetical protein COCC4DRAFT_31615 [Bipolaris maydis ATCC 48331]
MILDLETTPPPRLYDSQALDYRLRRVYLILIPRTHLISTHMNLCSEMAAMCVYLPKTIG